jgi:hypothetical protein
MGVAEQLCPTDLDTGCADPAIVCDLCRAVDCDLLFEQSDSRRWRFLFEL